MPDLDQLNKPRTPGMAAEREVLEGTLIQSNGDFYAKVDDSQALWGPLIGGTEAMVGADVCIGVAQTGQPFVLFPSAGGTAADCCTNVDGGKPDSVYGGMCNVDGNGVVRA
jgi:hypothetical protein